MKDKVFAYMRVSTTNQAREGYSLSYQEDLIKEYCNSNSLELIETFKDEAISGAVIDEEEMVVDRPALQEMLSRLQYEEVKYIVTLNTSRLWRSDMTKILIQRVLKKHNVDVRAIEQPSYSIYASDPSNVLINGIMEVIDEYARLEIAMKLSRGRKKKAEQGGFAGGGVVFGYTSSKTEKTIEVDAEQSEIVRVVFNLKQTRPDMSLAQIADFLNSNGYRTAKQKWFTKTQVKRILDHESFYRGIYKYGGIEVKGKHVSLI